jgi:hypothetical protein
VGPHEAFVVGKHVIVRQPVGESEKV